MVAERLRAGGLSSVKHLRAEGKFVSVVSGSHPRARGATRATSSAVPQAEFPAYGARDVQLIEQALRPALGQTDVVLRRPLSLHGRDLGRHGRRLRRSGSRPSCKPQPAGSAPDLVGAGGRRSRARARARAPPGSPPTTSARLSRKGLAGVGLRTACGAGTSICRGARAVDRRRQRGRGWGHPVSRVTELIARGAPRRRPRRRSRTFARPPAERARATQAAHFARSRRWRHSCDGSTCAANANRAWRLIFLGVSRGGASTSGAAALRRPCAAGGARRF